MTRKTEAELAFEAARAVDPALARQLEAYVSGLQRRRPETAAAYRSLVETLAAGDAGAAAAKPGDEFPPFLLPDENGRLRSSKTLLAAGPLLVSFNRGSWCPMCWLELAALNAERERIARLGGEVVSIVPEAAPYGRRLKARLGLSFPVLSDIDNGYALSLGLATALSAEVRRILSAAGIDLGLYQRNEAWFVPIPATFAVGRDGILRGVYVNADFRRRGEPADLVAMLA